MCRPRGSLAGQTHKPASAPTTSEACCDCVSGSVSGLCRGAVGGPRVALRPRPGPNGCTCSVYTRAIRARLECARLSAPNFMHTRAAIPLQPCSTKPHVYLQPRAMMKAQARPCRAYPPRAGVAPRLLFPSLIYCRAHAHAPHCTAARSRHATLQCACRLFALAPCFVALSCC